MVKIGKILVPVDGSPASSRAANFAFDLQVRTGCKVYLLYVAILKVGLYQHNIDVESLPDDVVNSLHKVGENLLNSITDGLPAEVVENVVKVCKLGDPRKVILQTVKELEVDAIAMGTRGLEAAKGLLLNSVSQYLMEYAPCPIMLFKEE